MIFAAFTFCIVIKSAASSNRFAITIKCNALCDIDRTITCASTSGNVDIRILKQLNSFATLCFRNRRCQIAVEFYSRYIQSDDSRICIVAILNKNIVCTISSYSTRNFRII